jgi:peptidoglycan/LPS O-acetylase OafA/YrhL
MADQISGIKAESTHWPELDGVRGVAILGVLLGHLIWWVPKFAGVKWFAKLCAFMSQGASGVYLFFVLSGFLITCILLRTKDSPHYLRNFYSRRILRIFPLYYLALALFVLTTIPFSKSWWFWFYLQNIAFTFWPAQIAGPMHFWSLAVEEHFYAIWPFIVGLLSRRVMTWCLLGIIILAAAIRALLLYNGIDIFYFTLTNMDSLALGALLALAYQKPEIWKSLAKHSCRMLLLGLACAVPCFMPLTGEGVMLVQFLKQMAYPLLSGFFLIMALEPNPDKLVPKLMRCPELMFLGKISYGLYVYHRFVYRFLLDRDCVFKFKSQSLALILEVTLVLGLTIALACISWVLFEKPILKLKRYFEYIPNKGPSCREKSGGTANAKPYAAIGEYFGTKSGGNNLRP